MADALARLSAALESRYRIERELGQGGMATVYLAEDLKHDRQVAIKVPRPELAAVIGAENGFGRRRAGGVTGDPRRLPRDSAGGSHGVRRGRPGALTHTQRLPAVRA